MQWIMCVAFMSPREVDKRKGCFASCGSVDVIIFSTGVCVSMDRFGYSCVFEMCVVTAPTSLYGHIAPAGPVMQPTAFIVSNLCAQYQTIAESMQMVVEQTSLISSPSCTTHTSFSSGKSSK